MASGTHPAGKLLDFEQFIEHQIDRTRSKIKSTDVFTALLVLITAGLGVLFTEVVLDHVFGLPIWFRRIVLWGGSIAAAAYAVRWIVAPLVSRVNSVYAARTIEETDPSFKNCLITYLDLRRQKGKVSKAAMAAVEAKAVKDLAGVEIDAVVNQRRLLEMAYALSGIVVVFCLYAAFTPKSILDSAKRAFLADVVRPTNTRLVDIKPGNHADLARVVSGSDVVVSVRTEGTRPKSVTLHHSADGGKFFSIVPLSAGENYYDPWQVTLRNVRRSLDYYLTGGDGESLHYRLDVVPAPMVTSVALDLEFPSYTGVPARRNVPGGFVEAIEGTIVQVKATTNEPAESASFEFSKGNNGGRLEVDGKDAHKLVGKFVVKETGSYSIRFKTTGGQINPDPVVYDIKAIPDRPPTELAFLSPDQPEITVPANVAVPMVMTAVDDHGVKDAFLQVQNGNVTLSKVNLLEGKPTTRRFKGTATVDLQALKVEPGAQLEYWLTVHDNKEPFSNRAETPHQIIKVGEPVKSEEKQAIEEKRKEAAEEAEKRIPPEPEADRDLTVDPGDPEENQTPPEDPDQAQTPP
ncbi:MAG: hypothetical protein AB7I30_08160, partial [Isosphaeraceae bacterium]